jgi:hypothetical protein
LGWGEGWAPLIKKSKLSKVMQLWNLIAKCQKKIENS